MRENFDLRSRWRAAIGAARACRGLRKEIARIITQGTGWHSAPTMKMITEAEASRHRGARHLNQTPRENNSICRHHRRKIVRLGAGWRDSWRRGIQNQQRRLRCRFLMHSTKPSLLPRPKTRETRREAIHPTHTRRWQRPSRAKRRRSRSNCVCPGRSTFGITAVWHVMRVRRQNSGDDGADKPFPSNFLRFDSRFPCLMTVPRPVQHPLVPHLDLMPSILSTTALMLFSLLSHLPGPVLIVQSMSRFCSPCIWGQCESYHIAT